MKKLFYTLAFAFVAVGAMAQTETPTLDNSVKTNDFWSNWFVQGNLQWNANYGSQEHNMHTGMSDLPWKRYRGHVGASVALGKWFSPEVGMRLKVAGIWGKAYDTSFKYWDAQGQALVNVSNILCGYNPKRFWNVIPFGGAGFARNMSKNCYSMGIGGGILNTFRINDHFAVNLEGGYTRFENDFVSGHGVHNTNKRATSHDNHFYAEIGLTWNIGKAVWDAVPDVDAINALHQGELDALNARLRDALAENDQLKNKLANQPKPVEKVIETPKHVKEFIATPVSVFFDLNKTHVASQYDLVNVKALAKYAVENKSNLLVKGFADSATGTPAGNQKLSDGRAATVKGHLIEMGVPADKIQTEGCGGVNDMSPIQFNRRATVQVVE